MEDLEGIITVLDRAFSQNEVREGEDSIVFDSVVSSLEQTAEGLALLHRKIMQYQEEYDYCRTLESAWQLDPNYFSPNLGRFIGKHLESLGLGVREVV